MSTSIAAAFLILGQSRSSKHISAHTPDTASSRLFFGHTPGFAGPADKHDRKTMP